MLSQVLFGLGMLTVATAQNGNTHHVTVGGPNGEIGYFPPFLVSNSVWSGLDHPSDMLFRMPTYKIRSCSHLTPRTTPLPSPPSIDPVCRSTEASTLASRQYRALYLPCWRKILTFPIVVTLSTLARWTASGRHSTSQSTMLVFLLSYPSVSDTLVVPPHMDILPSRRVYLEEPLRPEHGLRRKPRARE
jgi:hypothetical protein